MHIDARCAPIPVRITGAGSSAERHRPGRLSGEGGEMEKPKCPNCGSDDVVPIVYGLTTPEMATRASKKEIRIGGYAVGVDKPDWACNNCGNVWK